METTDEQFLAGNIFLAWAVLHEKGGSNLGELAEELICMFEGLGVDTKGLEIDAEILIGCFWENYVGETDEENN